MTDVVTAILDATGTVVNVVVGTIPNSVALPDGAGIGWQRNALGVWTAPSDSALPLPAAIAVSAASKTV